MKYAAIDLGTNTFNIIIAEINNGHIKVLFRDRHIVNLLSPKSNRIEKNAQQRSIKALKSFKNSIKAHKVGKYKAYATSMFRRAENGLQFSKKLEQISGIKIEIINQKKEATLVYKGAKMSGAVDDSKNLIMDIGGGSVEFIITENQEMISYFSYKIGILELRNRFSYLEPFTKKDINQIIEFLTKKAQGLIQELERHNIEHLIGTAGSFEVLGNIESNNIGQDVFEVKQSDFENFFDLIYNSTMEERRAIDIIPTNRKKLIVYAFILIKFALNVSKIDMMKVTHYSMKEGIISEIAERNK